MQHSSRYIEAAVEQMSSLPGIGKKSALRLVLTLLKRDEARVEQFARAFTELKANICLCERCHNLSDEPECGICRNPQRDHSLVCVVEDVRDVMAIENTQLFRGVYHVLGGRISPMDGIGPDDLQCEGLLLRCLAQDREVKELIMALSPTMEGETTAFYLYRKLKDSGLIMSTIAKGIGMGTELEYADEVTLGQSIQNRLPFEASLARP